MTFKHRFYFSVWKLIMRIIGIKRGTIYSIYSKEKDKHIRGIVTSLNGCSVTKKKFGFDFDIHFLEPLQGYDSRFYSYGSYSYKDTKKKLKYIK